MRLKALGLILFAAALCQAASADEPSKPATLIEHIQSDSIIEIVAPARLEQRLAPVDSDDSPSSLDGRTNTSARAGGYRIQVFSDNNARSAKTEARTRARNISSRFPQHRTYVVYNAPFWRLKVGDFRNQQEAQQAADEIKRAFPSYSREIRVIRDRVSVVR